MRKIKVIGAATMGHQVKYIEDMLNSMSNAGCECTFEKGTSTRPINMVQFPRKFYDIGVCWGVRRLQQMKNLEIAKNILVIENSYLNNIQHREKEWVSIGWNGLNGRANFYNKMSPSDRWEKHFNDGRMLEYTDGEYVLIPLQIRTDASIRGLNINYQNICNEIRKFTNLPIKIKQHPTANDGQDIISGKDISYIDRMMPIKDAVKNAKIVVTVNSNAGVDAVVAGKPVISLDVGSMVYDISSHSFEKINLPDWPDRTQWGYDIAYAQWHPNEIKNGEAWNHLKQGAKIDNWYGHNV